MIIFVKKIEKTTVSNDSAQDARIAELERAIAEKGAILASLFRTPALALTA